MIAIIMNQFLVPCSWPESEHSGVVPGEKVE